MTSNELKDRWNINRDRIWVEMRWYIDEIEIGFGVGVEDEKWDNKSIKLSLNSLLDLIL